MGDRHHAGGSKSGRLGLLRRRRQKGPGVHDPNVKHTPYSDEVAAAAGITAPMSLKKSNGQSVTVSKEALYNSAVVIKTIRDANWPGITDIDKNTLIVAALITMAQESTFYTNKAALDPDGNEDAGPFQQRTLPGWYADGPTQAANTATLQSIPYATLTFIEGHKVAVDAPGAAGPVGYVVPGVFQKPNRPAAVRGRLKRAQRSRLAAELAETV